MLISLTEELILPAGARLSIKQYGIDVSLSSTRVYALAAFEASGRSLDKASVDFFADIVKFFQKDYTILVITHNDRLKDKFSHAILVEQDINMVSRARLVSSW